MSTCCDCWNSSIVSRGNQISIFITYKTPVIDLEYGGKCGLDQALRQVKQWEQTGDLTTADEYPELNKDIRAFIEDNMFE